MMRYAALLLTVIAATATAGVAQAQCAKLNCAHDPAAWAAMEGASPSARAEQRRTKAAVTRFMAAQARAERREKLRAQNAPLLSIVGVPSAREDMVRATATMLSGASGAAATITNLDLSERGESVLMCGAAAYGTTGTGVFVWGTAPTDPHLLHATKAQFHAAGCDDPMVTFR